MLRYLLIILLTILSFQLAGQQSDSKLAYQYYQKKEYAKAAEVFLQLYERTKASQYLDYHIIALINNKDYDKAEESLKKYLKANDNNKDFLVNLGYVYKQQGKLKNAEQSFQKALDKLLPNNSDISSLANKFRGVREHEWANKTYLKGRKLLKNPEAYTLEIGDNYMYDRNYDPMLDQYFYYLDKHPNNINQITSKLNTARLYDVNKSLDSIVWKHLNQIFDTPDYNPVFDEFAVALAIQNGNFPIAYEYALKVDSKIANKHEVFMNVAQEARRSKNYAIAIKAYSKILQIGKEDNAHYNTASKEILFCQYEEYELKETPLTRYKDLITASELYLSEHGYINTNTDIILLLADIYSYNLKQSEIADSILQKGITIPRLNQNSSNQLKSKRADILALSDNPWEAIILYTQIEKANPNNDFGYEAKLKKAWMAYYSGDLLWANAQFSVLKGATSKLISNDAIKISHFIGMNYTPEEENSELEAIAQVEYTIFKREYREALNVLDSLVTNASTPGIVDYANLLKADLHLKLHQTDKASTILNELKKQSQEAYIQAEAIFLLAGIEAENNKRNEALNLYRTLITDYSGSVYSVDAAQKYRQLEQ